MLSQNNTQEKMSVALLKKATSGDIKAYEVIRDTIGEKQAEKLKAELSYEDTLRKVVDEDEY